MLPVRVLLVAAHPGLRERALDGVHVQRPRVVGGDQLGHLPVQLVALGPVGQPARRAIELVVGGQLEARVVGLPDVAAVEELRERVAFGVGVDPANAPRLQLACLPHLEQVRPLLLHEFDANADRFQVLLPDLVDLAVARAGRGRHRQ